MFDVLSKSIIQAKKNCKTWNGFLSNYFYEYTKIAKNFPMLGYTFKVHKVIKTKKQSNVKYFDQTILLQRRKLVDFQASFLISYVQARHQRGGIGGIAPPIFIFAPPIYFLPSHCIFS